jgi:hypothetical protein
MHIHGRRLTTAITRAQTISNDRAVRNTRASTTSPVRAIWQSLPLRPHARGEYQHSRRPRTTLITRRWLFPEQRRVAQDLPGAVVATLPRNREAYNRLHRRGRALLHVVKHEIRGKSDAWFGPSHGSPLAYRTMRRTRTVPHQSRGASDDSPAFACAQLLRYDFSTEA